ncbi:hypothetical protein AVEN_165865-1 [Araneus ventricosus]|uniref:Uncharacterized protein n=1 Tax=Araneus ventricosus TaxID=182803 RepID=A0A4Y2K5T6_ARAVE|nr:hypothetical protein AVEN_165865-1 [Araneus ventricosus]
MNGDKTTMDWSPTILQNIGQLNSKMALTSLRLNTSSVRVLKRFYNSGNLYSHFVSIGLIWLCIAGVLKSFVLGFEEATNQRQPTAASGKAPEDLSEKMQQTLYLTAIFICIR